MHRVRLVALCAPLLLAGAGVFVSGCSSSPDEAQMRQLDDLKKEYADLQGQVASKQQEKATLDREVAEKNARLKKCHDDEAVVKQRLAK